MAELGDSAGDDEALVVSHAMVVGSSDSWQGQRLTCVPQRSGLVTTMCCRSLDGYLLEMVGS